jgi:short-subunit dehydrogenase
MPENKVILVTGASSGFGKSTALLLAKNGFVVYGTSRTQHNEDVERLPMLQLDVDSQQSVNTCVSTLLARAGRVDVLINSAGQALTGALEETSIEEAKDHFETNFFGVARMVNAVLPTMRKQRSGQIINLGSIAGTIPVPFEGYYATVKAALVAYSEVLRHELKSFDIKVSIVEPGFFRTNLGNARKVAAKKIDDYGEMRERAVSRLEEDFEHGDDPKKVSELILQIVREPSPYLRYAVGREKRYLFLKKVIPASRVEASVRSHYRLDG